MKPDLSDLSISIAYEELCHLEYSALELTEACLDRVARMAPTINAFITLTPELAVRGAMQADLLLAKRPTNLQKLPLLGIPLGIKDLVDVAGIITTAGSKFFRDCTPSDDAETVLRLKLSGGVVLGKTNLHEIALGVTGLNPYYGAVGNPWNPSRISGGSSSGSAAAVATGMCLAAIGTDTGGSIRIPASLCGVVGLKPTYGRVSTRGVIPLSWNLDHVGPLTRTVQDAARMLKVLAGYDPHDPASVKISVDDYPGGLGEDIRGWNIALAVGDYIESADSEVLAAVNHAAQIYRDLGAQVEKVDVSWLAEMASANTKMTQADGASYHSDRMRKHPDMFGNDVFQRLVNGAALSSSDYVLARRTQSEGRRRFETFFERYDILLLPTTPVTAPLSKDTAPLEASRQLTRFTSPFNLTGLPAMSVPCGFTETGLPVGLQIVSKHWAEKKVLCAGYLFERATEWHKHFPDVTEFVE